MSEQVDLTDYVDSDSGEDSTWVEKRLGEIFDSIYSGGTPKKGVDEYYGGDIPFVKIEDLNKQQGDGVTTAENYITERALGETTTRAFESGTLLLTIYGSLAETALVQDRVATNQGILGLWDTGGDNVLYVRYAIDNTQPKLASLSRQTTQANLGKGIVKKHKIPIPPLPEQRKIATVLYTVDRAIKIADNILEQAKRVEQGLQQTLFTGEQLSCERKEAPTIGQVPVNWQIKAMGEVCNITMGSSPKSEHYNESGNGLPFFQANNEFGLRNPKHDRWCSNPIKTANKGDSLMTLRGTYVGQMNIADRKCCIGRGLAGVSAGEELLEEYLYQHLRRRERYVKSIAIGSTFDSVSSSELENLPIVIPPKEKQEEIAKTLRSVQERLRFTNEYTEQLHRLKRGLMQDLLSGTVRTTDTNIEVPEEIAQYG